MMSSSTISTLATSRNMEHKSKLRSEYTSKLEVESQRMEDRLKMLKTMMAAEKSRRDIEGGIHWKSGHSSQPSKKQTARGSGDGQSAKPLRVRVLTDKGSKSRTKSSTTNSTPCGQCDKTNASLSCIECVENYCQVCFIKIHQKGALAKHHVKPYIAKVTSKQEKKVQEKTNPQSTTVPKQVNSSSIGTRDNRDSSLLDGTYNEADSAASFQQALAEWRNVGSGAQVTSKQVSKGENTHQPKDLTTNTTLTSSTGTSTSSSPTVTKKSKVEISFSTSTGVSYFEKLMTRRNRYDPSLLKKMGPKPASPSELETTSDMALPGANEQGDYTPTPYNIFYSTDDSEYTAGHSLENELVLCRPMSSVQIEEVTHQPVVEHTSSPNQDLNVIKSKKKAVTVERTSSHTGGATVSKRKRTTSAKKSRESSKTKQTSLQSLEDTDLYTSVQNAWTVCAQGKQPTRPQTATELSQFFLQGVEATTTEDNNTDHAKIDSVDTQLKFAASIWLPFNSVLENPDLSTSRQTNDSEDSDSEMEVNTPEIIPSRSNSAQPTRSKSQLDELMTERSEWDQEDKETLESLAWELASTVESEGRLSRCDSELDNIDVSYEYTSEGESRVMDEEAYDVDIGKVDMSRVLSEFELYQQKLMDQEM